MYVPLSTDSTSVHCIDFFAFFQFFYWLHFFQGTGDELFDHIAKCLSDFVFDRELQDEVLPLGFTFSFPCEQEGLARGRLVKWTKGFNCSGVEGEDVVQLLSEAIERRGDVKIEVCAILNDTTGNEVYILVHDYYGNMGYGACKQGVQN